MSIQNLKKIIPFVAAFGIVGFALFGLSPKSQSDPEFKNVQVLTDLTMDELKEYMAQITEDIGAEKCTFCHVRDKSSDEVQHKVIAREFMKLVKDLNEGFFKDKDEKVTCFTCHRGEKEVVNHPGGEGEGH
ncbi:MAG: photosynthetic reaction center cytochrome c subunit [Candidatus Omnitrophica bacterium]|nr:photosynthetic reaction center cytochrome c subunit [Candidatus Omnitrophota bacterium]MCA9415103.1 photosynthetic reaction center cytochrome c subunit [Candidatus Omnitrophota bacterium]MCA9423633.1 photosynthetic reaction center cytochrome c subunit [Candidatus Omnitrophota bacterium]MCA9430987.1 photosynthetic reaction center cytochrome c subunit [Candidatus Omnitrophota bacterium]MCA9435815.1 photosynthetic reaction center cytochrome c subunit [Candidatus Omnitrophota bacterium]